MTEGAVGHVPWPAPPATGLRWAANLSLMFRERPFLDRFAAARDAGFDAVEFWWPRGERPDAVARAALAARLEVALLNMDAGDLEAGERGFLNRPECRRQVLAAFREALGLATAVGCRRIHAPVGKDSGASPGAQEASIVDALAAMTEAASGSGVLITLEPLNAIEHPTYLMTSTPVAIGLASRIGAGVGLQYDAYHMGAMGEDIVAAPGRLELAHVQLADHPGRHEPGTGRLPLAAFIEALRSSEYRGYVGLEYVPLDPATQLRAWWSRFDADPAQRPLDL